MTSLSHHPTIDCGSVLISKNFPETLNFKEPENLKITRFTIGVEVSGSNHFCARCSPLVSQSHLFHLFGFFYIIYVTGFHITRLPHTQNQTYDFTRNGLLV